MFPTLDLDRSWSTVYNLGYSRKKRISIYQRFLKGDVQFFQVSNWVQTEEYRCSQNQTPSFIALPTASHYIVMHHQITLIHTPTNPTWTCHSVSHNCTGNTRWIEVPADHRYSHHNSFERYVNIHKLHLKVKHLHH